MKALFFSGNYLLRVSLLVVLILSPVSAAQFGNFSYELVGGTKVTITDYPTTATGNISIPAVIDGLPVTDIGADAFHSCSGLTKITIPDSVTSIGNTAFSSCYDLKSIIIPDSITGISVSAFNYCTSLTSVTISSSVTAIGIRAFEGCGSLTSTYFVGNAPTSIGYDVFKDVAGNHIIHYLDTSSGFTSPAWNGYATGAVNTTMYPAAKWLLESNFAYDTSLNYDSNGDGVLLLMAYALDMNLNQQLGNKLPISMLSNDKVTLTYYGASAGVTYRVKASKNMVDWVERNRGDDFDA